MRGSTLIHRCIGIGVPGMTANTVRVQIPRAAPISRVIIPPSSVEELPGSFPIALIARAGDDGADRVAVEHFGIRGYGAVRPGNGNDVVEDRKRTRLIAVRRPADLLERIPAEPDVPLDRADDQRLEQRIARRCFTPSRAMQPTPESG